MGIPRFGELIRRRYPQCWFQEGKANVLANQAGKLNLSSGDVSKKRDVDTIYVDGNGLLHPAMQYAFAYGMFEDAKRQAENEAKTETQIIEEGVECFMNAIRSLCLEFSPERVVVAIDGSAPTAKMIQQRQRRFGAKMNIDNDPVLQKAWELVKNRSIRNAVKEEGSFVSIELIFGENNSKFGVDLIQADINNLQPGTPHKKIYDNLIANLVNLKGQDEKFRWYNILAPETPIGFKYEGRWWYSVAMAATALAWKKVYNSDFFVNLFGMDKDPGVGLNKSNKYIYGTGKIKEASPDNVRDREIDQDIKEKIEKFRSEKLMKGQFFIDRSKDIAGYCEMIADYLTESSPLYREILLLTGVGSVLKGNDNQTLTWLMNSRAKLIKQMERELNRQEERSNLRARDEVEYPEYENGFRGIEGVLQISNFDSNSLTPGTSVMHLIDLKIQDRIRGGKLELGEGRFVNILYSSHRVPGEGEHKLQNMIDREERNMNGKVSLIYGLDADLFMLSLVRDYPMCLIRENDFKKEKFEGKVPRKTNPKNASCHVVDIQRLKRLLREENSIDSVDFTLICFLFGNDFLRNVPGMVFDNNLQVVFDNKQTRNDEETNPYLFDFIFDVYRKTRDGNKIKENESLFTSISGDIIRIHWVRFYDFLSRLSSNEFNIFGGVIRKMQQEEVKESTMSEIQRDYVPVSLRYQLLKKSIVERQVIKGGVIDQRAEWIRGIDAFDMNNFKKLWESHITSNIPGFDEQGVIPGLVKDKRDVVNRICQTYLEGMEWALRYYTNRHSFVDKTGVRKSVLDTRWYYPYFHAPLLSQLKDYLWQAMMTDSRRLFLVSIGSSLKDQLRALFSPLVGKEITPGIKSTYSKIEKDILDIIPSAYFQEPKELSSTIEEQVSKLLRDLETSLQTKIPNIPSRSQYETVVRKLNRQPYFSDNTFSDRWMTPRIMHGSDADNFLFAPSSTNFKAQLLAVLPPQSQKYFPDGIKPENDAISWMYPKGIPVDFTFRDRIHAAILMIPPPNIPVLERFLKDVRIQEATDQIRPGMFPNSVPNPRINPQALKKASYFDSLVSVLEGVKRDGYYPSDTTCVDVFAGVGISSMALDYVFRGKIHAYEPNADNREDLQENIRTLQGIDLQLTKDFYNPYYDNHSPDIMLFDLVYELPRRESRDIRVSFKRNDREGMPIEGVIEETLDSAFSKSSKTKLVIVIKLPANRFLKKINSSFKLRTKFVKDSVYDVKFTYAVITVEKSAPEPERSVYDYYREPLVDPYLAPRSPGSPAYQYNEDYEEQYRPSTFEDEL